MKNQTKVYFKIALFVCLLISFKTYAQSNDAVKMILSSKSFTISEEYNGIKKNTYSFTKLKDVVEVVLKTNNNDSIKTTMPFSELENLENIFNGCVAKIKKGKKESSDLSKYTFINETTTYEISDNSSMICTDEINTWKKKYFPAQTK